MTPPHLRSCVPLVPLSRRAARLGPVLLEDLAPGVTAALGLLDGTRSLRRAAHEAGAAPDEVARAVAHLRRHGLLTSPAPAGRVRVVGHGVLAAEVHALLRAEGLDARSGEPASGWHDCDVVVVAAGTAEPDRTLTDALLRADVPHLVVGPEVDGAVVGPFVLPGRAACVRCVDETRASVDPGWGPLSTVLARAACAPEPAARAWAAALATAHVKAHLAGEVPASAGTTWHFAGGTCEVRAWAVAARCGCALLPSDGAALATGLAA